MAQQPHQLGQGESSLGHSPARQQDNLLDTTVAQCLEGVVGDIGLRKFVRIRGEDAGDVKRDIAIADDDDLPAAQVEPMVGVIGMAVVPGDEVGRGLASRQVFAGNAEAAIL